MMAIWYCANGGMNRIEEVEVSDEIGKYVIVSSHGKRRLKDTQDQWYRSTREEAKQVQIAYRQQCVDQVRERMCYEKNKLLDAQNA